MRGSVGSGGHPHEHSLRGRGASFPRFGPVFTAQLQHPVMAVTPVCRCSMSSLHPRLSPVDTGSVFMRRRQRLEWLKNSRRCFWRPSAPGTQRGRPEIIVPGVKVVAGGLPLGFGEGTTSVCQGMCLFPYPMKIWANGTRVSQTPSHQGWYRVHRAVERFRHPAYLSCCIASDLRSAGARDGHGGRRALVVGSVTAPVWTRSGGQLLVGVVDARRRRALWSSTHRDTPAAS